MSRNMTRHVVKLPNCLLSVDPDLLKSFLQKIKIVANAGKDVSSKDSMVMALKLHENSLKALSGLQYSLPSMMKEIEKIRDSTQSASENTREAAQFFLQFYADVTGGVPDSLEKALEDESIKEIGEVLMGVFALRIVHKNDFKDAHPACSLVNKAYHDVSRKFRDTHTMRLEAAIKTADARLKSPLPQRYEKALAAVKHNQIPKLDAVLSLVSKTLNGIKGGKELYELIENSPERRLLMCTAHKLFEDLVDAREEYEAQQDFLAEFSECLKKKQQVDDLVTNLGKKLRIPAEIKEAEASLCDPQVLGALSHKYAQLVQDLIEGKHRSEPEGPAPMDAEEQFSAASGSEQGEQGDAEPIFGNPDSTFVVSLDEVESHAKLMLSSKAERLRCGLDELNVTMERGEARLRERLADCDIGALRNELAEFSKTVLQHTRKIDTHAVEAETQLEYAGRAVQESKELSMLRRDVFKQKLATARKVLDGLEEEVNKIDEYEDANHEDLAEFVSDGAQAVGKIRQGASHMEKLILNYSNQLLIRQTKRSFRPLEEGGPSM